MGWTYARMMVVCDKMGRHVKMPSVCWYCTRCLDFGYPAPDTRNIVARDLNITEVASTWGISIESLTIKPPQWWLASPTRWWPSRMRHRVMAEHWKTPNTDKTSFPWVGAIENIAQQLRWGISSLKTFALGTWAGKHIPFMKWMRKREHSLGSMATLILGSILQSLPLDALNLGTTNLFAKGCKFLWGSNLTGNLGIRKDTRADKFSYVAMSRSPGLPRLPNRTIP